MNLTTLTKSSPLRIASFMGHLPMVKFLVEKGADVNSVNNFGLSVLMVAAYDEFEDIVIHLLDNGADVNYIAQDIGECCGLLSNWI